MYRLENELWWYVGMRRISAALLDGWLPEGARILDAGCGTGGNMQWLARYGTAYGIDLSAQAVRYCAQRRLPTVGRGSVLELPFGDASFDLVTSFELIEHRPRNATVVAETDMRLLAFDNKAFKTLLEEMPKAHDRVMEILASRLRTK